MFSLSQQLNEALRVHVRGCGPDEPLFLTAEGKRLEPDNFAKRVLKPILEKLGLEGCCHGFLHGNASALDTLGASFKVRQARLGHVDPSTTLRYSHLGQRRRPPRFSAGGNPRDDPGKANNIRDFGPNWTQIPA